MDEVLSLGNLGTTRQNEVSLEYHPLADWRRASSGCCRDSDKGSLVKL
jgi:hypothetical protein